MKNYRVIIKDTKEEGIIVDEIVTTNGKIYFYVKKDDGTIVLIQFNEVEIKND